MQMGQISYEKHAVQPHGNPAQFVGNQILGLSAGLKAADQPTGSSYHCVQFDVEKPITIRLRGSQIA
jgi:hypothetical protein